MRPPSKPIKYIPCKTYFVTMLNTNTIQSSLKPLFYFTKLLGLSPFKIENDYYATSWSYMIWSFFLIVGFVSYSLYAVIQKIDDSGIIMRITDLIHIYISIISVSIGIFFGCVHRNDIVGVINNISEIDKTFENMHLDIKLDKEYKKTFKCIIVSMIIIFCCIITMVALDIFTVTSGTAHIRYGKLLAYNTLVITGFIELQFCTLALLLKERFQWLNNEISKINKPAKRDSAIQLFTLNRKQSLQHRRSLTIENISIMHYDLCNIKNKLNHAYSYQLLIIIIQHFLTIVVVPFYLTKMSFSNGSGDYRIYFYIVFILHCIVVILLTHICSKTTKEARKTGILLHQMISIYSSIGNEQYLDLEIMCFSLQLLHHDTTFTACGMFAIDESLLAIIVSGATTYLVIVLQFEIGVTV